MEGLVPSHVTELLLQKVMDPVDGEVAIGAEDMEAAGEDELVIVVGGEATPLEVHHQPLAMRKSAPRIGFFMSANSKSQVNPLCWNWRGIILKM